LRDKTIAGKAAKNPNIVQAYYRLTKPGIIYGNAMTAAAGFLFGSLGHFDVISFFGVLVGTSLVIGAACVFNNIMDRHIDAKMKRTNKRALVTGIISVNQALVYGLVLVLLGCLILMITTNMLVLVIGLVGLIDYLLFYGFFKRRTTLGTLVGSICGATPIIAGYCAATGRFDTGALLLFLIMVFWQMPHFYAIAIYRGKDYAAADIPVLPVVKGAQAAKVHILIYVVLYIAATVLLYTSGYAGYVYLATMFLFGIWWLKWALMGFRAADSNKWARKMFGNSLIILLVFSFMISINYWVR
jgi:protoheme IX farnesyltransferase